MKKVYVLLTLLLTLVVFNSNAKCYLIGKIGNQDWNPTQGYSLAKVGELEVYEGTIYFNNADEFAITTDLAGNNDDGGWNYVNGLRYVPEENEKDIVIDGNNNFKQANNGKWFVRESGEYLVKVDFANSNVILERVCYIAGDLNGWDNSVDGIYKLENLGNKKFERVFEMPAAGETGFSYFSIFTKSNDWNARWGENANKPVLNVGISPKRMNIGKEFGYKVTPGTYKIKVDLSEMTIQILPVAEKAMPLYVYFNDGQKVSLEYGTVKNGKGEDVENTYFLNNQLITAGTEFYIADVNKATYNFGISGDIDVSNPENLGTYKGTKLSANGGNMHPVKDIRLIHFTLRDGVPMIYCSNFDKPTSVENVTEDTEIVAGEGTIDVACEGDDVKVYSINGVLVSEGQNHVELEGGIYIVKVGNTVKKVVVR